VVNELNKNHQGNKRTQGHDGEVQGKLYGPIFLCLVVAMASCVNKRVKATQELRSVFETEESREEQNQYFNDQSNQEIVH
jgi:hypothetical protein